MVKSKTYASSDALFAAHKVLQPVNRQVETPGAEFGRGEALGERLAQEVVDRFKESLREDPNRRRMGRRRTS